MAGHDWEEAWAVRQAILHRRGRRDRREKPVEFLEREQRAQSHANAAELKPQTALQHSILCGLARRIPGDLTFRNS